MAKMLAMISYRASIYRKNQTAQRKIPTTYLKLKSTPTKAPQICYEPYS